MCVWLNVFMCMVCVQAKAELQESGRLFWKPSYRHRDLSCLMWVLGPNLGLLQEQ